MTSVEHAHAIWLAGLDAVRSDRLVARYVSRTPATNGAGSILKIGRQQWPLERLGRIAVVGAGKAGAGMARGFLDAIDAVSLPSERLTGWINVPADCAADLNSITLHAARPAGKNEPVAAGVDGTSRILELVDSLGPSDLCVCLISGGGSAFCLRREKGFACMTS